jgi:hypothetical protein
LDQIIGDADAQDPDRGAPLSLGSRPREDSMADHPLHAFAPHPDAVSQPQLGVHPGSAMYAAVLGVDLADPLKQPGVRELPIRRRPAHPRVIVRSRDAKQLAHQGDRMIGLLRLDEPEPAHGSLPGEEGGRPSQDLLLSLAPFDPSSQLPELLVLLARRRVVALAAIELVLAA